MADRGCRVPAKGTSEPITADSTAQLRPTAPLEVYGATSPAAVSVTLTYTAKGRAREQQAVFMSVTDREVLESAGSRKPFGYFVGELPPDATKVTARAVEPDRTELGSVGFGHFRDLHPSGLHRKCAAGGCFRPVGSSCHQASGEALLRAGSDPERRRLLHELHRASAV